MDITLFNFQSMLSEEILLEGAGLYGQERVLSVTKIDYVPAIGTLYEARVKKTPKIHTLRFCITTEGKVITDTCFCGEEEICAHFAAVFYYMNEGRLVTLNPLIFRPVLMTVDEKAPFASLVGIIDAYLKRYQKQGKIPFWYLPFALEGCVFALMNVRDWDYLQRLRLYREVLLRLDRVSAQYEETPDVIEACRGRTLQKMMRTVQSGDIVLPYSVRRKGFSILNRLEERLTDMDTAMQILRFMAWFCDIKDIYETFRAKLERYMSCETMMEREDNEQLKIIFCLALRTWNETEAAELVEKHPHESSFRRMAVEIALERGDTEWAKRLCRDGIKLSKNNTAEKQLWYRQLYRVYEREGAKMKLRQTAKKLFLLGDFDYYARYKQWFTLEEWVDEQAALLEQTAAEQKRRDIYLQMIIEENREDLLFCYCKENPKEIVGLYPYFRTKNKIELDQIFEKCMEQIDAEDGSNKASDMKYAELAMKKALGQERAEHILKKRTSV